MTADDPRAIRLVLSGVSQLAMARLLVEYHDVIAAIREAGPPCGEAQCEWCGSFTAPGLGADRLPASHEDDCPWAMILKLRPAAPVKEGHA